LLISLLVDLKKQEFFIICGEKKSEQKGNFLKGNMEQSRLEFEKSNGAFTLAVVNFILSRIN
jgi:hypothetical protein